jgi:YebC/PmpR family DNA-binding regulatory protein
VTFEGYGPGGVAVLVETLTDNRNRTVSELRHLFSKLGGNLGEAGCVAWIFSKHGVLTFDKEVGEEALMDTVLEAGAEDIKDEEDMFTVVTDPSSFEAVKTACDEKGIKYIEASLSMVPQNTVKLDHSGAEKMLKLMDALEDHDDVQNTYANFDIDSKTMGSWPNTHHKRCAYLA